MIAQGHTGNCAVLDKIRLIGLPRVSNFIGLQAVNRLTVRPTGLKAELKN